MLRKLVDEARKTNANTKKQRAARKQRILVAFLFPFLAGIPNELNSLQPPYNTYTLAHQ